MISLRSMRVHPIAELLSYQPAHGPEVVSVAAALRTVRPVGRPWPSWRRTLELI